MRQKESDLNAHRLSRRQFIRLTAATGLLAGCGATEQSVLAPTSVPANTPSPADTGHPSAAPGPTVIPRTDTPTDLPTATVEQPLSPAPTSEPTSQPRSTARPDLVVARGGQPEALVYQALAALGGMERFVKPGADVIVKPNICVAYHTYEYAATTNPWVVGALVKLALAAGAKRVRVLDYPFGGTSEEAYARSGIQDQVRAAGGEMETISRFKFVSTEVPGAIDLLKADIYDDVLQADVLINVPIAKHHSLAGLTLGMKNLMGVIQDRQAIHRNLGQRIADLTSLLRPTLTVVDAVRMLMAHGPTGGNLDDVKQMDTIMASADIVAADSYAAKLFGKQPEEVAYIKAAAAMGLGRSDLGSLQIEELTIGS